MIAELSVFDRVVLLSILPEKGNFLTMKVVHQLRDALHFNEEEIAEFGLKHEGTQVTWETSRSVPVEIGPVAHKIVAEALKVLDTEEAITDREFSLYERFVEIEDEGTS
jgi:hypothetical protein